MLKSLFIVFLGGGLGSIVRYFISTLFNSSDKTIFPLGTFITNILSCVLVGLLAGLVSKNIIDERLRLLLMTGFCGGFSTFSTYILESNTLILQQNHTTFLAYVFGSIILGLFSCILGIWISTQL
jgi:fluoride exporter